MQRGAATFIMKNRFLVLVRLEFSLLELGGSSSPCPWPEIVFSSYVEIHFHEPGWSEAPLTGLEPIP